VNGEADHIHLLVNDPPKHSVSSLANNQGHPADCFGPSDQILPSDTGKTLCGRYRTSLPLAVEHSSVFSKEYVEQQRKPM
jgi:hypothetical protein